MLKNKELRRLFSLVLSFIIIFGSFSTFVHAENNQLSSVKVDLKEVASNKIMPEVLRDIKSEDLVEVLVYFSDQVDGEKVANDIRTNISSAITPYRSKLEVRRGLVEALRDKSEITQVNMINYLEQEIDKGNVEEYTSYDIVNMVYVKATKDVVENISFMPEVEKIYKNKTHKLDIPKKENEVIPSNNGVEWNIERVRANETWDLGYEGRGIVVANIDSGVDWTHPALKGKWRGYDKNTGETNSVGNWFDPVYSSELPADSDQHGTHVMGTMVGQEEDGSNKIGVAPGAEWIAARVFNNAGSTTDSILLSAAEWILAPGGSPDAAPDVVNNSWGGGNGIDSWYREAVTNWREAGIVPVFSAGNQRAGEPAPWPGSISVPSNYPESFAVAAIDRNDIRGSFSKLGPSPYDESIIKPDISGPGVAIRSSVPGGGYEGGWNGTSMSAPAVSGAVALLLSANSSLTVDEIEDMLKETADPLTDSTYPEAPNMGYGYGMVDTFESVSLVASGTGTVSGRVLVPGQDSDDPVIVHEQEISETYPEVDIEILAEISDDVAVTEVELLVKAEGQSYWRQAPMKLVSGDHKQGTYKGTITQDMLKGESVFYKIKVRDFAGEVVATPNYKIDIIYTAGELKYDDGTAENALVLNDAGNGLAVKFTPNKFASLEAARVYLWDEAFPIPGGNEMGFAVYNSNQEQVGETIYIDDLIRGDWNLIDLSSINFSTVDDFYISSIQNKIGDNSPAIGLDDDGGLDYSKSYMNVGGTLTPLADQGSDYESSLMIRAIVDYEAEESNSNTVLKSNTISKKAKVKVNTDTLKLMSDNIKTNKTDYVQPAYKKISDAEVQKMPMIFIGIPVKDAVVTVVETGRSVRVDPTTGKYFTRGAIGKYTLRAEAYGYFPKDIEVVMEEDENVRVDFVLEPQPQGTIEGRVVDRYDNKPAAYAKLRLLEDPNVEPVTADENGYFIMEDVLVGEYTVKVVADGFEPGEATVTVVADETANIEIELKRFVGYEDEIIYDDGTAENALVLNSVGYGLGVRFTPEEFGKVKGTNIFFWNDSFPTPGGNRIGVAVYDANQNQVGDPIFQDIVRGEWNYIDLSSFGFSTDEDFYISTIQDAPGTECPATGIDEESEHPERSYMNLDGEFKLISSEDMEGGLMIRATMEYAIDTPMITSPEPLTYTNQDVITVEGISTADTTINVYVNNEKVEMLQTQDKAFTVEVELPEDRTEIRVTAETDGKETEPSEAAVVIKDKLSPVLIVEEPLDNIKIEKESVHVIGNATDDIELVKVEINEEKVELDEDGNFHQRLILDPGKNVITVKAIDSAGNETVITRTVTVELDAPIITNLLPDEDMRLEERDVLTVSFNAPAGGEGYFRLLLPFGLQNNEIGIPMIEVDGLYTGTWTVPEEMEAEELLVEVVYINEYGYEVTKMAEGKVNIVSEDNPVPPVETIINMKPDTDSTIRAGDTIQMSFNGPAGGNGYYRIVLPFELNGNNPGNPMVEGAEGFYSATWRVPEGIAASNLLVEFVFEDANGIKMYDIAPGRLTIIGQMENLSPNSIIIGNEAFDMDYLNNNSYAQRKLLEWSNSGKQIFSKLNNQTIVTADGQKVDINELPSELTHFDRGGNITYFQK